MEKILNFLQQLDLSDLEAKLYLNLLRNDAMSVRDLAETIDIKRTTAYFYIDQLVEKGLVIKLVKGSKKMIAANPPETLEHLVANKIASAKHVEQSFPSILQAITIEMPHNTDTNAAEVIYYKGKNGLQKIYEEALQTDEVRSYVKLEETGGIFSDNIRFFNEAFRKNPNLTVREILYNSPLAKEQAPQVLSKDKQYFYKFMPKDLKLTSGDVLIYKGTVAIINYTGTISGVVFRNADYYNNSKELFDYIWNTIPERT